MPSRGSVGARGWLCQEEDGSVRSEKLSRGEFLRRAFGMGGVMAAASVLAACAPGEEDEDEDEDEDDD